MSEPIQIFRDKTNEYCTSVKNTANDKNVLFVDAFFFVELTLQDMVFIFGCNTHKPIFGPNGLGIFNATSIVVFLFHFIVTTEP